MWSFLSGEDMVGWVEVRVGDDGLGVGQCVGGLGKVGAQGESCEGGEGELAGRFWCVGIIDGG